MVNFVSMLKFAKWGDDDDDEDLGEVQKPGPADPC